INWLLGSIRRESFIKRAESIDDVDVQQKINKINSVKDRTAKYTLGDSSSALLKLKEQLEKEEK
ncbi:hypothetical protein U2181_15485, partial [Listeria monocytogenes]|uniref:hypothetical protein n=1 Tax=Listeria monocytogenes TaxID=1639 RepID=UPI002FDC0E73